MHAKGFCGWHVINAPMSAAAIVTSGGMASVGSFLSHGDCRNKNDKRIVAGGGCVSVWPADGANDANGSIGDKVLYSVSPTSAD